MNANQINAVVLYLRQCATPETYGVLERAAQQVEALLHMERGRGFDAIDVSNAEASGYRKGRAEALREAARKVTGMSDWEEGDNE